MFRIMPVGKHEYDKIRELGLNVGMVDTIVPRGERLCDLQIDECFWWIVAGTMEEVVEFLDSECLNFSEWKESKNNDRETS